MPAERGGDHVPRAVRAEGHAGLRDGVAEARQVDHEEGHHERAEAVDEDAAEQDPRRGGEGAELVAKCHELRVARCRLPVARTAARQLLATGNRQLATAYGAISGSACTNFFSSASSNCVPAPSSRRRRASCALIAGWYERRELMATKASQIWMTREASGMAVPLKRLG